MNIENLKYGTIGVYDLFLHGHNEIVLPVDTSYIRSTGLKKLIEGVGIIFGISFDFNEEDQIISIVDSAIFHTSSIDIPATWNIAKGLQVEDNEYEEERDSTLSSDFQRMVAEEKRESEKYHIDPKCYGILYKFGFFSRGDFELILPLDISFMIDDSIHKKMKKIIENMNVVIGFAFKSHKSKELIIFVDDNAFGDIGYRNEELNLQTGSLVNKDKIFQEFILEKGEKLKLLEKGILIFVSYSTKDSNKYRVATLSKELIKFPEIHDVLYWEEDMKDDIYEYMNKNIKKCDLLLLFCSQNALKSDPVTMEWQAALKIKKKIIPIFVNENEIPTLLSTKLGVKYEEDDFKGTIINIYNLIMKKLEKNK